MKRKLALFLASSMVLTALTACGSGNNGKADNPEWKGSVAMVMPGLITDEAFNQYIQIYACLVPMIVRMLDLLELEL